MAWQVVEQGKDASLVISQEANVSSYLRTFLVYEDDPAYTLPSNKTFEIYLQIRNATTTPWNKIQKVGQRLVAGAVDVLEAQFIVSDLQISPHPDRVNTFVVKQTSKAPLISGQAYRGVKITEQSRLRSVQTWVYPNAFPTLGNVIPWTTNTFVSGDVYNISGNPHSWNVRQRVLTVEFPVVLQASQLGYNNDSPPTPMGDMGTYVKFRNSTAWLNSSPSDAGKWLLTGSERRQLSNSVDMIVQTFVWDEWFHLEQLPVRNLNGELQLDASFTLGSPSIAQRGTTKVIWSQTWTGTVDFNTNYNVLPPGIKAQIQSPSPTW
jgi:hypothetical protein